MTATAVASTAATATQVIDVALIQSATEALHTPEHDLGSRMIATGRWRPWNFPDQTAAVALHAPDRFACVVVGIQSSDQSALIRRSLESTPIEQHFVVLHQHNAHALEFMSQYGLTASPVDDEVSRGAGGRTCAVPLQAAAIDPRDEVVLSWPNDISDVFGASASGPWPVALDLHPATDSDWEPVLSYRSGDGQLRPVLLRTPASAPQRRVVCTLDLSPSDPQHWALIENMVMFAAAGPPQVVVARTAGEPPSSLPQLLRLRCVVAAEAVCTRLNGIRVDTWPVRGTATILVRTPPWDITAVLGDPDTAEWLRSGGTIVAVEPDGTLSWHHGLSDGHELASRFARWFHEVHPAEWHGGEHPERGARPGSVFRTRAVLRVLHAFEHSQSVQTERLALPNARDFKVPVGRLLRTRMAQDGSLDGTVSTTVVALDLDDWTEGALSKTARRKACDWLRTRFDSSSPEDRLDIARALGDEDLARRALAQLPETLTPVLVSRARAVSGLVPEAAPIEPTHGLSDLARSLPLASDYLAAGARPAAGGDPLPFLLEPAVQTALATLGRLSVIEGAATEPADVDVVVLCGEIVARLRCLELDPVPTHVFVHDPRNSPEAERMLGNIGSLRNEIGVLRSEIRTLKGDVETQQTRVRTATNVVGGLICVLAVAAVAGSLIALGFDADGIVISAVAGVVVASALSVLARKWLPEWMMDFIAALSGGVTGTVKAAYARLLRSRGNG